MTWTMINKENELNAIKIKYSEQKNKIVEEFEEIKKEVTKYVFVQIKILFDFSYFSSGVLL